MKKLYTLGLIGMTLTVAAQSNKVMVNTSNQALPAAKTTQTDYEVASPVRINNKPNTTKMFGKYAMATKVGESNWDRQTNSSVYRRILAHPEGKISVNWVTSTDGSANNYLGRGSGYNHFNGTSWGPISAQRIEPFRAGYSGIDYNGTTEIIMSHRVDTSGKPGALIYNTNGAIGGTTWSSQIVLNEPQPNRPTVLWPRTVVSGDYMHVIANYTSPSANTVGDTIRKAGVRSPTVYSRFKISTSTWEVQNITLPGYDSTRWFDGGADGYAIDAQGTNVAVLMGGTTNDITLWKSTDNGVTWDTTLILPFEVAAFNDQVEVLDTPEVCDGSTAVRLDSNGKAHCFWGRLRILNSTAGDGTISVFLGTNSIDYWFEGRPTVINSIAGALDGNGNGTLDAGTIDGRSRYGNGGIATMPYAVRNTNGDLYLVYSAITEDDADAGGANFRDVYITFSKDNGATWSAAQNMTAFMGFNKEQMFASTAIAGGKLHMVFMQSDAVGFFSTADNGSKIGPFDIMYYSIEIANIDNGKVGLNENANELFSVSGNYPNPFHNSTILPIQLTQKAAVKVTVMNILGEEVYNQTFEDTFVGQNNIEINSNFKSGFYFYNVEAGGYKVSGKMLAE